MTGQESERPTKSQGQQLFTSRLQPVSYTHLTLPTILRV